eukprot:1181745-Prorocentrum_minimum.AAC.1
MLPCLKRFGIWGGQLGDFRSCGIVGSSGRLLKTGLGPAIDNHTAVFRFNDAPTRGFEPFVGSKSTLRVQNIEYCGFKERDGEILMHYTDPKVCSPKCKGMHYTDPKVWETTTLVGAHVIL